MLAENSFVVRMFSHVPFMSSPFGCVKLTMTRKGSWETAAK